MAKEQHRGREMAIKKRLGAAFALSVGLLLAGCVMPPGYYQYYQADNGSYSNYPVYSGYDHVEYSGVSLGIHVPIYPNLVLISGYPVYYAPGLSLNYFFYDGVYWVYRNDNWYVSSWYNGPWAYVARIDVPAFILRVPVRYYRNPPAYFHRWQPGSSPHWGEHWGPQWQQHRRGWDKWNRNDVPGPAPLPHYQRQYSGSRYPGTDKQPLLRREHYRYQPRDSIGRQLYLQRERQRGSTPAPRGTQQPPRQQQRMEEQRNRMPAPGQQRSPSVPRQQYPDRQIRSPQQRTPIQSPIQQRAPTIRDQRSQPQSAPGQRDQRPGQEQRRTPQGRDKSPDSQRGQGQSRDRSPDRGQGSPGRGRDQGDRGSGDQERYYRQ